MTKQNQIEVPVYKAPAIRPGKVRSCADVAKCGMCDVLRELVRRDYTPEVVGAAHRYIESVQWGDMWYEEVRFTLKPGNADCPRGRMAAVAGHPDCGTKPFPPRKDYNAWVHNVVDALTARWVLQDDYRRVEQAVQASKNKVADELEKALFSAGFHAPRYRVETDMLPPYWRPATGHGAFRLSVVNHENDKDALRLNVTVNTDGEIVGMQIVVTLAGRIDIDAHGFYNLIHGHPATLKVALA